MNIFRTSVALAVSMIPALAIHAGNIPADYPKELLYKGKPIDSLCFYETQDPNQAVSLASCGINAVNERKVVSQNRKMLAKGFIGYDYNMFVAGSKSAMPNGYSYYKVIGSVNGASLISTVNNSGGSGQFTAIFMVKREGDEIHLTSLASGDRCNNGIVDAQVKNQQLLFTTYITPYDFLLISNQNPYNLSGYNDLDSCATCCQAKAIYKINLAQDTNNVQLLSIDAGQKPVTMENQSNYQTCFNRLLTDYQNKGDNSLNPKQLDEFVHTFNENCVRKDA
jgi:hypothetical protein